MRFFHIRSLIISFKFLSKEMVVRKVYGLFLLLNKKRVCENFASVQIQTNEEKWDSMNSQNEAWYGTQ